MMIRSTRNGRISSLGDLVPYGNAVYNTATGRYEIPGQPGSFLNVGELNAALYAGEIRALAAQQPTPTSVMIGPYAGYPVGMERTLPSGVKMPEATYQQAVREGRLPEMIQSYMSYGPGAQPAPGLPAPGQASGRTADTAVSYHPRVTLTNLSRPGQSLRVGDWLRVEILGGPPNQTVSMTEIHNGSTATTDLGKTSVSGAWSKDVLATANEIGHWVEHWRVGNTPVTPILTFDISAVIPQQPPQSRPPTPPTGGAAGAGAPAGGGGETAPSPDAGTFAERWTSGLLEYMTAAVKSVPWYVWAVAAGLLFFKRT